MKERKAVAKEIVYRYQKATKKLLPLDSDNGAEFINDHLYRYCLSTEITFIRSRKHRKNSEGNMIS